MPSPDTRLRLILAAEKLFAERGIEAVSLREINIAAGQRNSGATHYHFGSKDGLIEAIFRYRHAATFERRRELADRIEAEEAGADVRRLVEALVLPLAEQFTRDAGGSCYVRFLQQVHDEPGSRGFARFVGKVDAPQVRIERALRRALSHVPRRLLDERLRHMADHIIHAFAARERRAGRGRRSPDARGSVLFASNLIDTWVGALSAPVSAATEHALAASNGAGGSAEATSGANLVSEREAFEP